MLSQFSSVATHCTQFSREQRFDSILEVRSLITKGISVVKIVVLALVLIAIGVAAFVYVPKIVEKSRTEKAERLAVDFSHELEKIEAETVELCEKYRLTSLDEPLGIPAAWKEDSVRICQQLSPFMTQEDLREEAFRAIENQKQAIIQSRQRDYDALLQQESVQSTDSVADKKKH